MSTSHTRQPAIPPKSPLRKASRTSALIPDDLDSRMLSYRTKHDDEEEDYSLQLKYDEPLYTEINIPLPSLPSKPNAPTSNPRPSSTKSSSTTSTSNSNSSSSSSSCSKPQTQTQASPRHRSRTLSSLLPFHTRSSSTPNASSKPSTPTSSSKRSSLPTPSHPQPHGSKIASRETAAVMDLKAQQARGRGRNRARTLDALAVVPAVLVLSAELFTPGEGEGRKGGGSGREGRGVGNGGGGRKDSGVGRWEDGIR